MKRGFTLVEVMIVIAIVGLLLAIVFGSSGGCSISDGVRKGTVSKFSHKGIVWKTYEGELVMGGLIPGSEGGAQANVWRFSIRNDNPNREALAEAVQKAAEASGAVAIKYHQSFIAMPWQAGTTYDVQTVTAVSGK